MSTSPPAPLAFSAVVDEFVGCYRELLRYLTREVRNADDAADLAQSSFEKAYAYARESAVASPRALLYRTADRLVIDMVRRRQVAQGWADEREALDADAAAPSAEQVAAHRQLVERVAAILAALPARRREVFLLFRAQGCTREEIARQLGLSEAAVAKHVVRATLDCARAFDDLLVGNALAPLP